MRETSPAARRARALARPASALAASALLARRTRRLATAVLATALLAASLSTAQAQDPAWPPASLGCGHAPAGVGIWSNALAAKPAEAAPTEALAVAADSNAISFGLTTAGGLRAAWRLASADPAEASAWQAIPAAAWASPADPGSGCATATLTGLAAGTAYVVRLQEHSRTAHAWPTVSTAEASTAGEYSPPTTTTTTTTTTTVPAHVAEIARLTEALAAAEGERDTALAQRDTARKDAEAAEGDRDAAEALAETLGGQLSEALAALATWQGKAADWQAQAVAAGNALTAERLAHANTEAAADTAAEAAEAAAAEAASALSTAEGKLTAARQALGQRNDNAETLAALVLTALSDLSTAESKVSTLTADLAAAENARDAAAAELSNAERALSAARQAVGGEAGSDVAGAITDLARRLAEALPPVAVPTLIGQGWRIDGAESEAEPLATLTDLGLTPELRPVSTTDPALAGIITGQHPAAGSMVARGTAVAVTHWHYTPGGGARQTLSGAQGPPNAKTLASTPAAASAVLTLAEAVRLATGEVAALGGQVSTLTDGHRKAGENAAAAINAALGALAEALSADPEAPPPPELPTPAVSASQADRGKAVTLTLTAPLPPEADAIVVRRVGSDGRPPFAELLASPVPIAELPADPESGAVTWEDRTATNLAVASWRYDVAYASGEHVGPFQRVATPKLRR